MKREVIGEEHPEEKSMKVVRPGRKALMAVMALFIGFRPLVSPKWPRRSPLPPPCVRHRVGRDSEPLIVTPTARRGVPVIKPAVARLSPQCSLVVHKRAAGSKWHLKTAENTVPQRVCWWKGIGEFKRDWKRLNYFIFKGSAFDETERSFAWWEKRDSSCQHPASTNNAAKKLSFFENTIGHLPPGLAPCPCSLCGNPFSCKKNTYAFFQLKWITFARCV